MDPQIYKKLQPIEFQRKFLEQNTRPDGRKIDQFREADIITGSISRCQGSSTVKIGNSIVVCGIKAEITTPLATKPKQGFFIPNIDLHPICSPKFKPGPPGELTQSLSQQINELFTTVPIINLEQLCIETNKAVWVLFADIICLNYDGSILDAAMCALMGALMNVALPRVVIEEGIPKPMPETFSLKLERLVLSSTFSMFDNKMMVDPTDDESEIVQTEFSIFMDHQGYFCGQSKTGGDLIDLELIKQAREMALARTNELVGLLN